MADFTYRNSDDKSGSTKRNSVSPRQKEALKENLLSIVGRIEKSGKPYYKQAGDILLVCSLLESFFSIEVEGKKEEIEAAQKFIEFWGF